MADDPITDDPEFFECELIPVPPEQVEAARSEVSGCENCSADAQIPFGWILADVMGRPGMFEFVLAEPVKCPLCHADMTEKTLVDRGRLEVTAGCRL